MKLEPKKQKPALDKLVYSFGGITPLMVDYYLDHYLKSITFVRSSAIK